VSPFPFSRCSASFDTILIIIFNEKINDLPFLRHIDACLGLDPIRDHFTLMLKRFSVLSLLISRNPCDSKNANRF